MTIENIIDFNLKVFSFVPYATKRLALLGVIGAWLVSSCWAAPGPIRATSEVVTSLAALDQLAQVDDSLAVSLTIEGTVWWSSKAEGRIILSDETAVLRLDLKFPCEMPDLGDRLILEGDCLAVKSGEMISLSGVPVVDDDGVHFMNKGSGTIHLKEGLHPIRVAWFDRTKNHSLSVSYEGPGLSRQEVPAAVLFRRQVEAESAMTNYVNGLNYCCYEGPWWRLLPNIDHIPAVKTGVVDNFDIAVRSRDDHVGLYFTGFIKVPKDGDYTFHLQSDDGSRLFIGDSSLRVHMVGRVEIPSSDSAAIEEMQSEEPDYQWSEIEGSVLSLHRSQGTLTVEVMTKVGQVNITIAEDSDRSFTLMSQNRIRVVGLSRRIHTVDRGWVRGEFFVQHWDDVEQEYVAPQIWTDHPLVEIEDLIKSEQSSFVGSVVHLRGRFASQDAGKSMMLEDKTGRILLDDAVPNTRVGQLSDVLGRVARKGSDLVLQCVHIRRPLDEGGAEPYYRLPLLTTAERISQLSLEEAARNYPVRIRGVITSIIDYVGEEYEGVVIQDATRGIFVNSWGNDIPLKIGDYCEIEGETAPFGFQPDIQYTRMQKLGSSMLPNPAQPTWDQLINGAMHCNYVELEGILTSIKDSAVVLLTRDGSINVRLNPFGADIPRDSLGARIRLRGCLISDWDGWSHQIVVGSIYLDQQRIMVVNPAPVDPFSIPVKRISDLLQFDPQASALQRVKVSGQLIYQDAQTSYLMDGNNGLRFIPAEAGTFQLGDRLEVVGFVDLNQPSPLMRHAVVQRVEHAEQPPPRRIEAPGLVRDEYDSTLVQVEGVLLGVSRRPEETVYDMQSGLRRFVATVSDRASPDELPKPGSRLELTGVYMGQGGNRVLGQPIDSFRLLLNASRDVRVLSRPPWWTFKRLMTVVGLLVGVFLAALVWINLLRHKVKQRTQQLGDQIRKRQRAERQRALEHERARLAHDLHDELGSGLTEVNMLAILATGPATPSEEKVQYTDEMNKLLSRMVLSLDEIVWAENPKNDTIASLAGYFGAHAQRLLDMASVGCGLDMADDLPDHPLDPGFRRELFLAFKEAITNVVKHAKAAKVWVRIAVQNDDLVVVVSDDGRGFMLGSQKIGSNGLANMQERLSELGGHCEIQSDPGRGTTIHFQAPIQRVET